MQQVLVTDFIGLEGIERLRSYSGVQVVQRSNLTPVELYRELEACTGLVVRSRTLVTRSLIESAGKLQVIGRAGIGVDNIDVAAATENGVLVMNTPGANSQATAELTVGLMFALARHISSADSSVKAGGWERSKFRGTELFGKTLGIIGIGNVGKIVAHSVAGLGMDIVAYDPYIETDSVTEQGISIVSLNSLISRSDYITVHTPLSSSTRGLIGIKEIYLMKKGVYLINCARAGIIEEEALLIGLDRGIIAGAALDVYSQEPPDGLQVVKHPRVVSTPHIGASSIEAEFKVATTIADNIGRFLTMGEVNGAVNKVITK